MTKPKTRADVERSLDADWPPHQPITLMDLVAGARAVEWDFTTWCYVSGYDASDPDARSMFECLLAYARREGVRGGDRAPIPIRFISSSRDDGDPASTSRPHNMHESAKGNFRCSWSRRRMIARSASGTPRGT
jgi:hypothetical protein